MLLSHQSNFILRSGMGDLMCTLSLWSDAHITASTRRFSSRSLICLLCKQEPFWNESGSVLTAIMYQQLHQRRARRQSLTTLLTTLTHFFLVAFCVGHAQEDAPSLPLLDVPEQSGVLLLSASDVAAAVLTFQPLFVLFDSPTRKGSLELFRTFADAAVALRASQREIAPHMRFAAMDATEPSDLLDELNVVGLPVFLRFRCSPNVANLVGTTSNSGSRSDTTAASATNFSVTTTSSTSIVVGCSLDDADIDTYTSGRTSAELQRFMLEQPQKEVAILHDRATLDALVATHPFVVLIVVDGRDTQPYFDAISLAQTDAQAISMYAVSANRALLDTEDERQQIPSVVVFRDFGATRILYTGPWKKSRVVSFLQLNKYSLVSTYSHEFSGFLFDGRAAAHVLLFSDATSELGYHEKLMTQAEELAQQYASTIGGALALRFVYVPKQETALRDAMFVKDHHVPIVLIIENVADPPFRFPLFGQELIAALETSQFLDSLGELLATKFPPVFQTADGDVDVDVAVDDSPGFEDTVVSASPASTTSSDAIITADDEQQPSRLLREVVWADHTLSPWEIRRQQSHIMNVSSALWVLDQQQYERKHVVVCFSSPRCYGCRAFAKVFEEVAHLTIDALDALDADRGAQPIIFAKVNVDEVDITPFHLDFSRLPSIYVFPSGRRGGPIQYNFRSFTRANVLAFVGETCSTPPAE